MQQSLITQLLPRWHKKQQQKYSLGREITFTTNWFPSELKQSNKVIHQYAAFIQPQIPEDSTGLRDKIMKTIRPSLNKSINFISGEGLIVYGRKKLNTQILLSQFEYENHPYKFQVMIKHTNELNIGNFVNNNPTKSCAVKNIANINLINGLKNIGLVQLKRGQYYYLSKIKNEKPIFAMSGYSLTVVPSQKAKFYVQIDLTSRILRSQNFNQTYQRCAKDLNKNQINLKFSQKRSVITNYGQRSTYSIIQIDFSKSPRDKFQTKNGQISYIDYYLQSYKYKIIDHKQPLLKVKPNRMMRYKNNFKNQKGDDFIYLIPEMVSLTGLDQTQRADRNLTKSLIDQSCKSPKMIMGSANQMIDKLNKQDLIFKMEKDPLTINGRVLKQPKITMQKTTAKLINGNFFVKKIEDPYQFKSLAICYSIGKNQQQVKQDNAFADDALYVLQESAKMYGMKFQIDIIWITVDYKGRPYAKSWIDSIDSVLKNEEDKPEEIVFLLNRKQQSFYDQIKKYTLDILGIPSQCIKKDNINYRKAKVDDKKMKKLYNISDKIVCQMNAKMGLPIWNTHSQNPYWKNNSLIVGGIAMSKGKEGSFMAFNGTNSKDLDQCYSDCVMIKNAGQLNVAFYQDIYLKWIRSYYDKNHSELPMTIVIYRQGLNDKQAKITLQFEIQGLFQAINMIKKNHSQYNPTITELLVNKKTNTHLFVQTSKDIKNPIYQNAQSGSIVYDQLSIEGYKEFLLVSHQVRQGNSCCPVVYRIGYEKGSIPLQVLGELTYKLCFQYFNWSGAIKIPSVLQNANKMSKLHSQIGLPSIQKKQLKSKQYYL